MSALSGSGRTRAEVRRVSMSVAGDLLYLWSVASMEVNALPSSEVLSVSFLEGALGFVF